MATKMSLENWPLHKAENCALVLHLVIVAQCGQNIASLEWNDTDGCIDVFISYLELQSWSPYFFAEKKLKKKCYAVPKCIPHEYSTAIFAFIWPASVLNILWQFCYRSLELISLLKLCRFKKSPYLSFDLRRLCEFSDTPKDILFPVERKYIG